MREDMYKVIVERPRGGRGWKLEYPSPSDPEMSPRRESLRSRHQRRKWLNENLRPLERYLASQVGRPWDKVFSEICAGIDRRNTVQQHIHLHLGDFVAIKVVDIGGELHYVCRWGEPRPLRGKCGWGPAFYVDPRTGLLLKNKAAIRERRARRTQRRERLQRLHSDLREDRRILAPHVQLHRIAGVWYRIELAPIDEKTLIAGEIDALRNLPLVKCPRQIATQGIPASQELFGDPGLYARAKRQLNARELRFHDLRNHA
ncbi:MAG: hypothetical protein E6Q88_05530 [Lysobacteraceae bacterium]|nr:MAG: hypothetical protein E6Q88_05530 [Xanthomonadaceae bacterium]